MKDFTQNENQIALVVINENILGYIFPENQKVIHVLHASILRGASFGLSGSSLNINHNDSVRLASDSDFNDYNVSIEGYDTDSSYLYNKSGL